MLKRFAIWLLASSCSYHSVRQSCVGNNQSKLLSKLLEPLWQQKFSEPDRVQVQSKVLERIGNWRYWRCFLAKAAHLPAKFVRILISSNATLCVEIVISYVSYELLVVSGQWSVVM